MGDNSMYCMIFQTPYSPSTAFGKGSATPTLLVITVTLRRGGGGRGFSLTTEGAVGEGVSA